jgi:hypothetical protein
MGASFQATQHDACDKATLRAQWKAVVKQCEYDYGHAGYSGTFAEKPDIDISNSTFDNDHDASEHVMEVNDKWGPVDAVKVKDKSEAGWHWYIGGWCSE